MLYIYVTRSPIAASAIEDGSTRAVIPDAHGPALRSAIQEIRNELGERLAGAHNYDKEDALTRAASALGAFAGALNQVVNEEDKHYA